MHIYFAGQYHLRIDVCYDLWIWLPSTPCTPTGGTSRIVVVSTTLTTTCIAPAEIKSTIFPNKIGLMVLPDVGVINKRILIKSFEIQFC
jgi:hypothetical protein